MTRHKLRNCFIEPRISISCGGGRSEEIAVLHLFIHSARCFSLNVDSKFKPIAPIFVVVTTGMTCLVFQAHKNRVPFNKRGTNYIHPKLCRTRVACNTKMYDRCFIFHSSFDSSCTQLP
jgi:hypothetical protein